MRDIISDIGLVYTGIELHFRFNSRRLRRNDIIILRPGRVAQSVGHLTRKSEVLGSIPGLANILSFLLPLFQEGQLSVTGENMCTKYWISALEV